MSDEDIPFPEDTRKSRLNRKPKADAPDEVATAEQRIKAFWRLHPDGNILTEIETREVRTDELLPYFVHTARAFVRKNADSDTPDATAHATRSDNDPDEITAAFPQETAETSAIARAIRNLGIRPNSRRRT